MALKERISSPLEAGPSILDAHHLPPHLAPALEYASARLARRALHLSLVVVRRDHQLPASALLPDGSPSLPSTPATPASPPPSASSSSSSSSSSGRFTSALKLLVRTGSRRSTDSTRSAASACSTPSVFESPRQRWPMSPTTPLSPPPMTPCTTASSATTDYQGPLTPGRFSLRLVHAPDLSPRALRILSSTLARAEQKFGNGGPWLPPAVSPAACGLSGQLFSSSVAQNELLFSSEGLTLVSLDRLYSLKSALSSYAKTRSPLRLEDAVDELRRYVLASGGAKVTRADLLRSYDWLAVSAAAIADLDRMYRRAYGGPEGVGAISGMSPTPEPVVRASDDDDYFGLVESAELGHHMVGLALTTAEPSKAPSPRGPLLRIQTGFRTRPLLAEEPPDKGDDDDGDDDDGDLTARPKERLTRLLPVAGLVHRPGARCGRCPPESRSKLRQRRAVDAKRLRRHIAHHARRVGVLDGGQCPARTDSGRGDVLKEHRS